MSEPGRSSESAKTALGVPTGWKSVLQGPVDPWTLPQSPTPTLVGAHPRVRPR